MPERSNTYVDIPEEARRVKDDYAYRPGEAFLQEVRSFVRNGGEPYLFYAHTHTRPPDGSKPVYLDEFDLPESARNSGRLAPCPCCTPNDRKYGRRGKIAWFPSEAVVRLLGPDCFASLDREGHDEALEEMRREKKRRQNARYLLKHHGRLLDALATVKAGLAVALALDSFADDLNRKVGILANIPLWGSPPCACSSRASRSSPQPATPAR